MIRGPRLVAPLLILASMFVTRPLVAQAAARWILLADVTYHAGDFEPFRIFLARGIKYRMEFSEPKVVLQMRSFEGKSVPFVRLIGDGPGASGETDFELAPNSDGVIEFRAVDGVPGTAVRFRLWQVTPPAERDLSDTASSGPRVQVGLIFRVGTHFDYVADSFTYAHKGSVAEGCLAIRAGGGLLDRLGGCVVGYSHLSGGLRYVLDFAFTEPHVRILGPAPRPGTVLSAGALIRLSTFVGTSEPSPKSPPLGSRVRGGIGIYGAVDQEGARRHGFHADAEIMLDGITAETDPAAPISTPPPGSSSAVSIRIGGGWFF